jgi:hypothetical protein
MNPWQGLIPENIALGLRDDELVPVLAAHDSR